MNTLALSTKVQNGVKPPAKKHEVIAAMAQVKFEQMRNEQIATAKACDAAEKEAKAALVLYATENPTKLQATASIGYSSSGGHVHSIRIGCEVVFENLPKPLQKLIKKAHELKDEARSKCVPELRVIKQQIATKLEGFTPTELRVKSLIETPETRKAIEKMLAALDQPKPTITIAA